MNAAGLQPWTNATHTRKSYTAQCNISMLTIFSGNFNATSGQMLTAALKLFAMRACTRASLRQCNSAGTEISIFFTAERHHTGARHSWSVQHRAHASRHSERSCGRILKWAAMATRGLRLAATGQVNSWAALYRWCGKYRDMQGFSLGLVLTSCQAPDPQCRYAV